jgi:ubiquinone/menaquinone biosynthesis C-methylase UbiE
MEERLKKQQESCDLSWRKILAAKKEQLGNLQLNLDFLKKVNLLKQDSKILEIGCGIGTIVSELGGQGYDITGADISQEAIAYGLKKYGDIKLEVQPAEVLPYEDRSFDIVLSFDLFEHIDQIDRHISEVFRVLCHNGYYLFQTPNKYSNVIFETLSKKSLKWRKFHPSLHTPRQLKQRMTKHGFEVRFIKMNPINEFTIKKLQKLGPMGNIVKLINFRRLPIVLQTNLYVVAHKT